MPLDTHGSGNRVEIGSNVALEGRVIGDNNQIVIGDSQEASSLTLFIHGHGNRVLIDRPTHLKGLQISCGNHIAAHDTALHIGEGLSVEGGGIFLLYNSGNVLRIGRQCMFSHSLVIRCGDSPHLLFEKDTGRFLDVSEGVFIGDHVWIGERVYVTKRASVPDESVVAACSLVTKRFETPHSVLAGNPARVVRSGVQWIRNPGKLEDGSIYRQGYDEWAGQFPRR
jgi:acetyltransferase-like isoleucine patch superfamily enzyme